MAPGHIANRIERIFNIDRQIKRVFTGHVAIVQREDDRNFYRLCGTFGLQIRVLGYKGVRHVDHVSDFTHGLGNTHVVDMNACQRIGWPGRRKNVVGLKFADFFPEGREQWGCHREATVARDFATGEPKDAETVLADARGSFLFLDAETHRFFARAEVVAGFSIGANEHARVQFSAELAAPEFECPSGDKLEIVEMRMYAQYPHSQVPSGINAIPRTENCK